MFDSIAYITKRVKKAATVYEKYNQNNKNSYKKLICINF